MYPATQPRDMAYSRHSPRGAEDAGVIDVPERPRIVATSVVPSQSRSKKGSSIRAAAARTIANFGWLPEALSAEAYVQDWDGRPSIRCSASQRSRSSSDTISTSSFTI